MKITQLQLRRIIKEEISRARRLAFSRETISGSIVSAVQERDGTWSIYSWDGEPISEDLTKNQAIAEFERIEAANSNRHPHEND